MINKGLLILCLMIGIILIVIAVVQVNTEQKQEKIVYRYIPRTFDQEQSEPTPVTKIFASMFDAPNAFARSITDYDFRKKEVPNKFFISQD
jgi:hypothetical protein